MTGSIHTTIFIQHNHHWLNHYHHRSCYIWTCSAILYPRSGEFLKWKFCTGFKLQLHPHLKSVSPRATFERSEYHFMCQVVGQLLQLQKIKKKTSHRTSLWDFHVEWWILDYRIFLLWLSPVFSLAGRSAEVVRGADQHGRGWIMDGKRYPPQAICQLLRRVFQKPNLSRYRIPHYSLFERSNWKYPRKLEVV